jgi:hypothetical protein
VSKASATAIAQALLRGARRERGNGIGERAAFGERVARRRRQVDIVSSAAGRRPCRQRTAVAARPCRRVVGVSRARRIVAQWRRHIGPTCAPTA